MRIDTSEPSLTALFNKGQVGLIRTEFMRKDDVIAGLRAENTALWGEKDALAAENERLRKAGDAMALAYCNLDVDGYEEESAEMLMQTLPTLKAWLAAKGVQS